MKITLKKVLLAFLLAIPFLLILLPSTYFDEGQSYCLSVVLLDMKCIGCGLTRGVMHLLHFEFELAWEYNKLSFIIVPIAILFWFHLLGKLINKPIFVFFDKLY